uniref:Uncharacterized protein n=1 Tax=Steinernema glaseri TaxID=37863 RepID=A0A1I7Y316_9BILA
MAGAGVAGSQVHCVGTQPAQGLAQELRAGARLRQGRLAAHDLRRRLAAP